jgi:protein SCO1/2
MLHLGAALAQTRWGAEYFPNVALTTHEGATVRLYDDLLEGKAVAINVIYTSCKDECPLETARLVQLQRLLGERVGRDIFFYSISIDPKNDTPQILKAYAEKFGVGPGWLFLTGRPEDIRLVTKKLGLSRAADLANVDGHTASLMVGNVPAGQWMRNSAVDDPGFLAGTIARFLGWKDALPSPSYAEARELNMTKGQFLFRSRCSACHTLGEGDRAGPDLAGVTKRRDPAWLARYVRAPDLVLAERDPIAVALSRKYSGMRMPNLGLGPADVADVVRYLDERSAGAEHDHRGHAHTH